LRTLYDPGEILLFLYTIALINELGYRIIFLDMSQPDSTALIGARELNHVWSLAWWGIFDARFHGLNINLRLVELISQNIVYLIFTDDYKIILNRTHDINFSKAHI
jgi:hypothetical protein